MAAQPRSAPAAGKAGRFSAENLPRMLLIVGPESALREDALTAIRTALGTGGDDAMSWLVLHGPANQNEADALTAATVLDEACTASMFAAENARKVVVVRQAEHFLNKFYHVLERSQDSIPDTTTIVFETAGAGRLKSTNFYKSLAGKNAVVACESLSSEFGGSAELELELQKRSAARGLSLIHGAMRALLIRSSKSLAVLEEELDKLVLGLMSPGADHGGAIEVREEHIQEICSDTATYTAFNFADIVLEGDAKRALEVLDALFDRGLSDGKSGKVVTNAGSIAIMLLGALNWKLSTLQDIRAAMDGGMNEMSAFAAAKIFGGRQQSIRRALSRHNSASLRRAVNAMLQANLNMRRGGSDAKETLQELVWALCLKKRN